MENREIKFRFVNKIKKTGKIEFEYWTVSDLEMEDSWQGKVNYERIDQNLFTGIKDKDGAELYEDDFVETTMHYGDDFGNEVGEAETKIIHVKWEENECSQMIGFNLFPSDDIYKLKLIGNKFDNPELLNK